MTDLNVEIYDMKLKNPVMPAAGPPIRNGEVAHKAKEGGAGAIVTKTISTEAADVPRPCMAEVDTGFLNSELWSEHGPNVWLDAEYPEVKKTGLPIIVGLGYSGEDIRELAPKVEPYADALELSTHYLGGDPSPVIEAIEAAKESVDIPVFVKLSPDVDISKFAKAAEDAGADGIVLINSFGPCLDIDLETGEPLMGSKDGYGWLSGDAIFPLALRCVFEACGAVDIPVIGVGGISSGADAIKMIMAGAQAVQVCTAAILEGPQVYGKIVAEMENILEEKGYSSLDEIRGLAQQKVDDKVNLNKEVPKANDECTTCGICKKSCPYQAITIEEKALIDEESCFGCGLCVTRCPVNALKIDY
ncbi:4Fe-4S binding protein [Selenihalanaerobacter shriftii]|uniref:Dihydroorotate dehydrogenase B (NAD(+)), catalytic subunit n=1 Tax=Selenihalanaerobacter shriftii TaxID=142842 RepID=A0A1T4PKC6_9FIRM|nr:4Fe-4S binding protein [Selenihalanaerobacter shriftii]SJZ91686.1 dihydroorotate dehydrogenase (subfamily 1) family protein [Selenihalanaerobacter shriftii]